MIEVINQQFLLAVALEFKIADIIEEDRQALCQAAATFSDNAKTAQANVVRTMAAYLTTATFYFASPTDDMVLRMFEELGAPLMYVGKCTDEAACPYDYFESGSQLNIISIGALQVKLSTSAMRPSLPRRLLALRPSHDPCRDY